MVYQYYLEVACNFASCIKVVSCILQYYTRVGKGVYIIIAKHYTRFLMDHWNMRVTTIMLFVAQALVQCCEEGRSVFTDHPESPAATAIMKIATNIHNNVTHLQPT